MVERYLAVLGLHSSSEHSLVGQRNGRTYHHDSVYYDGLDGAKSQDESSGVHSHGDPGCAGCSVVVTCATRSWCTDSRFMGGKWLAGLIVSHYEHCLRDHMVSVLWAMATTATTAEATATEAASVKRLDFGEVRTLARRRGRWRLER